MNNEYCYENYRTMNIIMKTNEQWILLLKLMNNEFILIKTNKQWIYSHENLWKMNIF